MNKILLPAILFCLLFIKSQSQDNPLPGYVLLDQYDTIFGLIDDKSYSLNSLFCDFKSEQADSLTRYYPGDIYGYRFIDGKYYISKEIKVDDKDSLLFLEFLIHGKVDFYFMQDIGRINHYYAKNEDSPLLELKYINVVVKKDGKDYLLENKQYISVLEFLTRDDPGLAKEIPEMDVPNHRNLIKLGETYHNDVCKDWNCIIYHKKIKYNFMVEAAAGYKLFSQASSEFYRMPGTLFTGFNFYVNNPRFSERSYFGFGIFYEGNSIIDSSGFTHPSFKIPITYSYSTARKGFRPIISAGITLRCIDKELFTTVIVSPGLMYNFEYFNIKTYVELELYSIAFIPLVYHSTNFGLSVCYKIE